MKHIYIYIYIYIRATKKKRKVLKMQIFVWLIKNGVMQSFGVKAFYINVNIDI